MSLKIESNSTNDNSNDYNSKDTKNDTILELQLGDVDKLGMKFPYSTGGQIKYL